MKLTLGICVLFEAKGCEEIIKHVLKESKSDNSSYAK